jgi:hypothetical protein
MKVKTIFIHMDLNGAVRADASIDVPGLGVVNIQSALSEELIEAIKAESIAALRMRLGQTLVKEEAT